MMYSKQIKRVSTVFENHRKNESIHSNSMSQIIDSPFKRKLERPSISTNSQKGENSSSYAIFKFKKSESLQKLLKNHNPKYILEQYNLIKRYILLNSVTFEKTNYTKRTILLPSRVMNSLELPTLGINTKSEQKINVKFFLKIIEETIEKQEFIHQINKKVYIKSLYETRYIKSKQISKLTPKLSIISLSRQFQTIASNTPPISSTSWFSLKTTPSFSFSHRYLSKSLNLLKLRNNINFLRKYQSIMDTEN